MGSNSISEVETDRKRQRLCTPHHDECDSEGALDLDRISNLPDGIISHILSLLEIKCAMRTSILSSRWRYLWTSIDNLHFSDSPSFGGDSFAGFVDHVLFHSTSKNIREFDLYCDEFRDLALISTWICYVLATKKVSHVTLYVEPKGWFFPMPPLPRCILTCNTLVSLSLQSRFDLKIPTSTVSFPCLKDLLLVGVYPDDAKLLHKLLVMCPVLQYFHLQGYLQAHELVVLSITIPSLKKLSLELRVDDFGVYEHNVIINTPNLEELRIEDQTIAQYTIQDLGSVCKVDLWLGGRNVENAESEHVRRLAELITSIAGTKYLFLSSETIAVLTRSKALSLGWCDDWPTFPNLTELVVWTYDFFGWALLPGILRSSPYLECLQLVKDFSLEYRTDSVNWIAPEGVPGCLMENVVVVSFDHFKGQKDELEVVKYLLKNAQVLEVMNVGVVPRFLNDELTKKLVSFPRYSSTCNVDVYKTSDLWQ